MAETLTEIDALLAAAGIEPGADAQLLLGHVLGESRGRVQALAIMGTARGPAIMLLIGGGLFAVTLYAMALGGPRWLGAVTPVGGTLLIAGWLWAAWLYWRV